ncbi:HPF/RaiA family ribosome-associated protein [Legionella sainthelensi]|uniref:RNA polymerase subunit sigma-54 n=1 Tax=Legionella sainthelensi TaxID=28087 RepID=A0A2H5FNX6_9GAMM|nr:HPF/RaiA family ribosome-associated protein [Legionella sainthelensi]AUH73274.1 ribosome-associated translation inhibitor RaiA [Legionella sainthelensi]
MSSVQITFRSVSYSSAIECHIDKHYNKLKRIYRKINNCRVVIDREENHRIKGKIFSVCINMTLRSKELASKKQNQNLYIALRDGFSAIDKLLEKQFKRKMTLPNPPFTLSGYPLREEIKIHSK